MIRKLIIFSKSILDINIIIPDILKNGPNGIILSLFVNNIIRAIGNAINVAKNIVQIASGKSNTNPNKNNSNTQEVKVVNTGSFVKKI